MPECCKECFLLMAIKIDVKASAATELHKGPACQPFKPASAASSITELLLLENLLILGHHNQFLYLFAIIQQRYSEKLKQL